MLAKTTKWKLVELTRNGITYYASLKGFRKVNASKTFFPVSFNKCNNCWNYAFDLLNYEWHK